MNANHLVRILWNDGHSKSNQLEHIYVHTYAAAEALAKTTVPKKSCVSFVIVDLHTGTETHPAVNGVCK